MDQYAGLRGQILAITIGGVKLFQPDGTFNPVFKDAKLSDVAGELEKRLSEKSAYPSKRRKVNRPFTV
jgi:hypothetical protein